jgi:hypothetical protein
MTNYVAVLQANYAGTEWSISDNDYDTLQWFSNTPKPTQTELDAAWPQVDYADQYAAVETARRTAYEQQSDGLFFEWQRGDSTEAAWREAVAAVKVANPYPPEA